MPHQRRSRFLGPRFCRGRIFALLLCAWIAGGLLGSARAVELDIFDEGMFADGEVEIVNGRIIVRETPAKAEEKPEPDPAGDQVLELTDGSQLHGELVALNRGEVIWKRADATEPLIFTPQEVRRLTLSRSGQRKPAFTNATIKLVGSDWLAGDLATFTEGRFVMGIGMERPLEIAREKVEWLALSPRLSPDAYDGPIGPMGLAGWESAVEAGSGWDYADGALVAKNASPIVRQFDVLPEKVDIQFTAGDGGSNNRGLTLWLQPGNRARGYGKGSAYLRFQSNTVNANYSSGDMKNFSANIGEEKEDRKLTRYRLLFDRRDGRLVIIINGKQVADWDLPDNPEPAANGSLSWQPSYWSSNMAWTLSNVRVQPWDGSLSPEPKENEIGKDFLSTSGESRKVGTLEGISAESIAFSGANVPRATPMFVRLAATTDAVEPPPSAIARVWLTQRGEFDVTGIGFRDGVLKVRTSFGGDLALPAAAIRAIEFPHKLPLSTKQAAEGGDTLVFKNGDQLRGTLIAASHAEPLRWQPIKGDKPVEFATSRLAGVLLAGRPVNKPPVEKSKDGALAAAVRLQNGDWLPGELQGLDAGQLRLRSELAQDLRISRDAVKSIYLSGGGEAPVWDGASERDAWIKGTSVPGYWGESNVRPRRDEKQPGPWRYLDGAFTLVSGTGGRASQNSGPNLGRTLQALPDKVDVSFLLSTTKGPASYSIQLFFDENKPGFMIQGGWDSAYMYDMAPRRNGANFFNQPQQLDFGTKVGSEGNERHFRFLGERKAGRLWMFVNGQFVGSLSKRAGGDNPKGKGISIIPQPMLSRVTVSNLWIAPWSGTLPPGVSLRGRDESTAAPILDAAAAKAAADATGNTEKDTPPIVDAKEGKKDATRPGEVKSEAGADVIALTNGDETVGKIIKANGESITVQCDLGELEVPLQRASLVEFAPNALPAKSGIRLRFAGKGALTVESLRVEKDRVVCQSAATGELSFPLSQITEIIYNPSSLSEHNSSSETKAAKLTPEGDAVPEKPGAVRGAVRAEVDRVDK